MSNNFNSPEGNLEEHFVDEYFLIDQFVGNTLLVWGSNRFGEAGVNSTNGGGPGALTPVTTFAGGTNWKSVSGGSFHQSAIKTDGTLWTWGLNVHNSQISVPTEEFGGSTNWKQVSASVRYFRAAIKTDGTLWTWGENAYTNGVLGINDTTNRSTPVTTFAGGTNWKQVSCGTAHIAAIKTDGTLWTWGRGTNGQLGTNDTTTRSTPVTTFAGGTNWKQVSGGSAHTTATKTDGTLWTWGSNSSGQLGTNDTTGRSTPVTTFAGGTNWKQVSGGSYLHTSAIKTDGTLWVWGYNDYGGLGTNDTANRSTPVTTFAGGTNWKQVSCNGSHTAAIKTDGTLWTWGYNGYGNLGINDTTNRSTPVTTFAGGTNWKQVTCSSYSISAITSGTDPTLFVS